MPSAQANKAPTQLEFEFEASASRQRPLLGEPLLTIKEVCAAYNVKAHVVRRSIKNATIPSYRLGNGRIRLRASDIEVAITASKQGGTR